MLLKKEENIIVLGEKFNLLSNEGNEHPGVVSGLTNKINLQCSLPLKHSTPVCRPTNKSEGTPFAQVDKGKKTCSLKTVKTNKSKDIGFLHNRFEILSVHENIPDEDQCTSIITTAKDLTGPKLNKMLICADSHGHDLAWHLI